MNVTILDQALEIARKLRSEGTSSITNTGDKGEKPPDWRMQAMLAQVAKEGAIPILVAKDLPMREGFCFSCGDRLQETAHYRCAPCVLAATLVVQAAK